jgi:uncharacterized protein (TIGR00730 family)
MRNVCVFCGSRAGGASVYAEQARALGTALAARGWGLVYGGGQVGLMGVVADAVLAAGGRAVGVIPRALATKELAHAGLTALHVVETMHQRKALMADLSDAFIALPGGYGTLDEFFEIVTWAQLGLHAKPVALLNTEGYFDPLRAWVDRAVADDFLRTQHRDLLLVHAAPEAVLDALARYHPAPAASKWIQADDR